MSFQEMFDSAESSVNGRTKQAAGDAHSLATGCWEAKEANPEEMSEGLVAQGW